MTVQYSIQKMVSDGTLSTIALGIQYLQRNDIYMRIAGEETPQSGAPSGYTWSFIDNTTLKILPVVPNGVEVVVHRRTDTDAMYNVYNQNAQFDEATIDENNQQLLYIAQEYLEQGIPGAGVESVELVREDGTLLYYRIKLTDGSYTPEFIIPRPVAAGFEPADFDFVTGGTLSAGSRNRAVYNPAPNGDNNWYSWGGVLPKVIPAGSTPETTGGFGGDKWIAQSAAIAKRTIRSLTTVAEIQAGVWSVGDMLEVTDRAGAHFSIFASGNNIINGFDVLSAGSGKVAVLSCMGAVDLLSIGAVDDGVYNNGGVLNYVLSNSAYKKITVTNRGGVYAVKSNVSCQRSIEIEGIGQPSLDFSNANLSFSGAKKGEFPLSSAIIDGSNSVGVVSNAVVGDICEAVDRTDFSFSNHRQYYYNGTTFKVSEVAQSLLKTTDILGPVSMTANSVVNVYSPITVTLTGLDMVFDENVLEGLSISKCANSTLTRCSVTGGKQSSVGLYNCYRMMIESSKLECTYPVSTGYQYGVVLSSTRYTTIENSTLSAARHGVSIGSDGGAPCEETSISGCDIFSKYNLASYVADIHGSARNTVYSDCVINGGCALAGLNAKYINCKIYPVNSSVGRSTIVLGELVGGDFEVSGCDIITNAVAISSSVIASPSTAMLGKISASYNIAVKNNSFLIATTITDVVNVGCNDAAQTVMPSVYMGSNRFHGALSQLLGVVRYSGVTSAGFTPVISTGIYDICDLNIPKFVNSTVAPFRVTSGAVSAESYRYTVKTQPSQLADIKKVVFTPGVLPASATVGTVVFNSTTNKLVCWDGSTWRDLF